jgi:hypothetical protein
MELKIINIVEIENNEIIDSQCLEIIGDEKSINEIVNILNKYLLGVPDFSKNYYIDHSMKLNKKIINNLLKEYKYNLKIEKKILDYDNKKLRSFSNVL